MNDIYVFDVETKRSFDELGGFRYLADLGVSVISVYSYQGKEMKSYEEREVPDLLKKLKNAELLIGFNIKRFDLPVLQPYTDVYLNDLPVLDIMDNVKNHLGYPVSLNRLAEATLGKGKSGDGLKALAWYKEGKIDLIKRYCEDDVTLTKDLFEFGLKNEEIYALDRDSGERLVIPADWQFIKQANFNF